MTKSKKNNLKLAQFCYLVTFTSVFGFLNNNSFFENISIEENNEIVDENIEDDIGNDISSKFYTSAPVSRESTNLTYSNRTGMNCSLETEEMVRNISKEYNVPYEIMMTIGEKESGGYWNTTGVISSTNDYGLFQINECNLDYIYQTFGYTKDDILYNDYCNTDAAVYLVSTILERDDVDSLDEIYGMYNGWTNWKKIDSSVNYSSTCLEIMNDYFPNYTYKTVKNMELKKKL